MYIVHFSYVILNIQSDLCLVLLYACFWMFFLFPIYFVMLYLKMVKKINKKEIFRNTIDELEYKENKWGP